MNKRTTNSTTSGRHEVAVEPAVLGVHSEVGALRQAIVHRPGLELTRLTPDNIESMLFDDVLWAARAGEEHDVFVGVLRDHGVQVHYFAQLLAEALDVPQGRQEVLDLVCTEERVGPSLVGQIREMADDVDGGTLATYLIGGITKADLHPKKPHSLLWASLSYNDFVLPPLPNHLFQRDNVSWVYGGVTINPMAKAARQRETINSRAIYRHHPLFVDATFDVWLGREDRDLLPASLEGGDVHVIGNETVLIGMGERSSPMAIELLATELFNAHAAKRVVVVELPKSHAFMHLDTVMTMIDNDTFIVYPYLNGEIRSWTLTRHDDHLKVKRNDDVWKAIAEALDIDKLRVLAVDEDERAAQREQWDDGTNFLAVAPGVVVGWDRNVATNKMLTKNGIEVLGVSGSELGRGRGGPRCMTCPIQRDAI